MRRFQGRGLPRVNLRYVEVLWCKTPVYIERLSVQDLKGELGFQIYCAEWLASNSHDFWHHSAGENRGSGIYGLRAGMQAKRSGQAKGFPDWICPQKRLAIELKLPKGAVSDDQWRWLAHFKQIGWYAEVVRSFERFKEIVEGI